MDDLIFTLLGLPNPFSVGFDFEIAEASLDILDLDLTAGLNFLQEFAMTASSLTGMITFENNSSQVFDFINDIVLTDASTYDLDHDGLVEFDIALAPNATLANNTDLGINFGYQFDVLKGIGQLWHPGYRAFRFILAWPAFLYR